MKIYLVTIQATATISIPLRAFTDRDKALTYMSENNPDRLLVDEVELDDGSIS